MQNQCDEELLTHVADPQNESYPNNMPYISHLRIKSNLKSNLTTGLGIIIMPNGNPSSLQIGFGPVNGVVRLKLIEAGVPQDNFALLTLPSLPFILILPFAVSRYLSGTRSMRTFVVLYIAK